MSTQDLYFPDARHPSIEHVMQFFVYEHLTTPYLREVSKPFCELAREILRIIPKEKDNPQLTIALQKLLEAKDAAVRAALAK